MDQETPDLFAGLRPLRPGPGLHKGTRDCEAKGCAKTTREGKPFCSAHIEQAKYIQKILGILETRDQEEVALEQGEVIGRASFLVKEATLLLRTKDFTSKSFSRRLDLSHDATARLVDLLVDWGVAKREKSRSGGCTIVGTAPKDLADGL